MKILINTVSAVALFSIGGVAMAEQCPDKLQADAMYDCIVVEAADSNFKAIDTNNNEPYQSTQTSKTEAEETQNHESHAGL